MEQQLLSTTSDRHALLRNDQNKDKSGNQVKNKCASCAAPMTKNHLRVISECKKGLGKVSNKNLRSQDTWLDVQSQAGD